MVVLERGVEHRVVDWGERGTNARGLRRHARQKRCIGLPVVGCAYGPRLASFWDMVVKTSLGERSAALLGRLRKPGALSDAGDGGDAMESRRMRERGTRRDRQSRGCRRPVTLTPFGMWPVAGVMRVVVVRAASESSSSSASASSSASEMVGRAKPRQNSARRQPAARRWR